MTLAVNNNPKTRFCVYSFIFCDRINITEKMKRREGNRHGKYFKFYGAVKIISWTL